MLMCESSIENLKIHQENITKLDMNIQSYQILQMYPDSESEGLVELRSLQDQKYASIMNIITLPETRKLLPSQKMFTISEQGNQGISEAIKNSRNTLLSSIQKQCEVFDNVHYQFIFPDSMFPDVPKGQRNTISYEQQVVHEDQDTFKDRLSPEQIKQIAQKGQFEVLSSKENVKIPYVWKINDTIYSGYKNRVNVWQNGLSGCYRLTKNSFKLLLSQIPKQIITVAYLPAKLFSLIVGRRKLTEVHSVNYDREISKDFWDDIMMNQLKDQKQFLGQQFFKKVYLPFQSKYFENHNNLPQVERKKRNEQNDQYQIKVRAVQNQYKKMTSVEDKFQNNWLKIRKRILMKVSAQVESNDENMGGENNQEAQLHKNTGPSDQDILEKFQEEKFNIYQAHLKQNLPKQGFQLKFIEAIIQLIMIISLIEGKLQLKQQRLSQLKEQILAKIKKSHTIKSRLSEFVTEKLEKEFNPIKQKINSDFYEQLLSDHKNLKNMLTDNYIGIYLKYVQFRKTYEKRIKQKKNQIKPIWIPSRVFRTTYMLLPPYQVKKQAHYYYCITYKEMTVDTSTNFWKFKLYAMRMKSWTINCLVTLIALAWVGPFGFRCLFGIQQFNYQQYCDYQTGFKLHHKRKPFLLVFKTVLQGIKKSRQHFESLPDRGLFGKNFSRIFNYIQCYVFRLLIVGIISVLVIYPILIVVLSIACIVLIVTFWAWVPIIMIVCYLFNILVFQFESSYIPSGIIIRSIPLLSLAILLVRCAVIVIANILFAFIIAPLLSVLYFIFLFFQRFLRTLTDALMLFLFRKIGRTPSKNTVVARKISGPGMSRSYFSSIMEDDVYILTQCELQKIFVDKFILKTNQMIKNAQKKYTNLMNYVLNPFGYQLNNYGNQKDVVMNNISKLNATFSQQVTQYKNRYPKYPGRVRFTQEQIDIYFENAVKIVKNFVSKAEIQKWIFDQYHLIHEDYDQLTRIIWIRIFNCGEEIFQPLEQIDKRFTIHDTGVSNSSKAKKYKGSFMKALEGQVTLNRDKIKFSPAKRSLLTKDKKLSIIATLTSLHRCNSQSNISINVNNPIGLLVPHRNLEQLKIYDNYCRQDVKKRYPVTFEE